MYVEKRKTKNRLEGQLIEAIGVLSNALKAGHSFQSAMSNIATDMEAPISEEFGRVFKETQRGMTLEESMNRMVERTDSDDLICYVPQLLFNEKLAEIWQKFWKKYQEQYKAVLVYEKKSKQEQPVGECQVL